MAGIATRYVTENELNNEMSMKELSRHAPALDILLTDKIKRDQARRRFKKGYNFSEKQVFALIPKQTAGRKKEGAVSNTPDTTQEIEPEERTVNERLDSYVVSNIPNKQALADVMIMLCIRPGEIKDLHIFNGNVTGYGKNRNQQDIPRVFRSLEKNEERVKQLLIWIQEAISSGQGGICSCIAWFKEFIRGYDYR
ncbi:hypothetical protein C1646_770203 [Rhizophagus diaphanus]|nr:hypothetical protein C1646_770203 [Rhizophagus diaphanus] [Rhizophagus sp. MUCL 43196]